MNRHRSHFEIIGVLGLLLCLIIPNSSGLAQSDSDTTVAEKDIFLAGYPLVFYLPETRWAFAAAGILTVPIENNHDLSSNVILGGAYTLNKQILSYLTTEIYWKRHQFSGELGYYDYFYPYYGVGPRSKEEDIETYSVRFPRLRAKYYLEIAERTYAGVQTHYDYYDITEIEEDGLIERNQAQFKDGGHIFGLGINLQRDRRDNIFFPKQGQLMQFDAMAYNNAWGSEYNFITSAIDISGYWTLVPSHYLAANIYLRSSVGDVPFQELGLFGGPDRARGYVEGRFRDKSMAVVQLEYRFPIYWRFRGVLFGSVGNVGPDLAVIFEEVKANYGLGLRFLLSKEDQLYIRLDYGFSKEGGEFYLTFGEAF